jgi:hypothetical protein
LLRLQVPPYDPGEVPLPPSWQAEIDKPQVRSTSGEGKEPIEQRPTSNKKAVTAAKQALNWAEMLPWIELIWYGLINYVTMYVFLYKQRGEGESVIRFMW